VDLQAGAFEELLSPEEAQLPNGMAWDIHKRLMYFVDTGACSITAYRTDEAGVPQKGPGGRLQAAHSFSVDAQADGAPDGMTIDRCWHMHAGTGTCHAEGAPRRMHVVQLQPEAGMGSCSL
jgi:sugar lactone lactonase YvrE